MKDLPYFLALVKKNLILWTIITTGTFSNINFEAVQYDLQNPHFLILKNYSLSKDDRFKEIWIISDKFRTSITFKPVDPKYLNHLKYYFGTDKVVGTSSDSYSIDTTKFINSSRLLAPIKLNSDTTVDINLQQSTISLNYTSKEYYPNLMKKLDSLRKADSLKN